MVYLLGRVVIVGNCELYVGYCLVGGGKVEFVFLCVCVVGGVVVGGYYLGVFVVLVWVGIGGMFVGGVYLGWVW